MPTNDEFEDERPNTCPNCGGPVNAEEDACENCGAILANDTDAEAFEGDEDWADDA